MIVQHDVTEPQCKAIDQQRHSGTLIVPNGSAKVKRTFNRLPACTAVRLVPRYPFGHFSVKSLRRGNIDQLAVASLGLRLRKPAFA